MPKNVMKLLKPSPHRARNDFDLSHRHVYAANFGELLPSTCIETVPGDHIEMHASDLIRAIPMVTSPFLRAKQHLDVWFVPYADLWHNFNNFITQKTEPVSSAFKAHAFCPYVPVYNLDLYAEDNQVKDIIGRNQDIGAGKLRQLLGYGTAGQSGGLAVSPSVNVWRVAAYNFIWYNEYRQQYYDDGTHLLPAGYNPSYLFNFDYLSCDTLANAAIDDTTITAMFQMRYRCWKKDLFTGLLPGTQFGSVSTIDVNFRPIITTAGGSPYANRVLSTIANGQLSVSAAAADGSLPSQWTSGNPYMTGSITDVLALRKSEAIQIWRENALRAGNHVKDNMIAHYGVESDFRDHRPTFLGSVSAPLNIGDVMTTANSSTGINDAVGDIAGKGLSSLDEKVFKFDAKDFGVIMVIASILPEAEYNAFGLSRPNQLLETEDYFIPEYENLGLEAVSSLNFHTTPMTGAKVIGYAPRYYAYKTKLDKCYGSFTTGGTFAPWCSPKYDVTAALATPPSVLPLATLYVNPKIFDVNFSVSVDNSAQFLCDMYFDVDAVRPMSVVGLPFS